MIVDDEKSYVDLLTLMLGENLDCKIHSFTRPLEALAQVRELGPAVIITDYDMPQLNGLEFMRQALEIQPNTTFVMITGRRLGQADVDRWNVPELKSFIPKPFRWRHLAEEVIRIWPSQPAPVFRPEEPSSV
jgi:two-component SAPR family response regulator